MPQLSRTLLLAIALLMASPMLSSARDAGPWWKATTVYQIYPRSFQDSDGDGIGDLEGIISRLDYLKALGFETLWISPFFASPQGDFGYDISDYTAIAPEYGTMETADSLIAEVHRRDMKIVFDLVLNHTSEEHPWFVESKASKDNPKSDWYVWREGKGKRPPNNWINVFNKQAWHYSPERDQYYYTAFLEFQPDLNWENPEVRQAMFDMIHFWMDKGVDGFRLDIFNCIMEDPAYADNPFTFKMLPSKDAMKAKFQKKTQNINHPKNIDLAQALRDSLDVRQDRERFLVGEALGPLEAVRDLAGNADGLNLVFLFDMIYFDFNAKFFRERIEEFEEQFPEPLMPTIVFGNHDNFRRSRRIKGLLEKDRLLTFFQFTARGVPFTYYGEEVGMLNASIKKKEALDPISRVFKGLPQFIRNILPVPANRDVCRTPMQWDDSPGAGFSSSTAWLPVADELDIRNVQHQSSDDQSLLETYRQLLILRNEYAALQTGTMTLLPKEDLPKNVLGYIREADGGRFLVLMNFSGKRKAIQLDELEGSTPLYGLHALTAPVSQVLELNAYGGVLLRLP